MKYNIIINQKAVLDNNLKLDIIDIAIYDFIKSFTLSDKCGKMIINNTTYYWINSSMIIEQMPILNISTERGISKRIDKLVEAEMIDRYPKNKSIQKSLFKFGKNAELYEFSTTNENSISIEPLFQATMNESSKDNNIIYNTSKEDTSVSKKDCEIESHDEDYIKFRKWMKDKCPFCDNPKNFSSSRITEEEFIKLKSQYTGREIASVIFEIENRKDLRKKYCNLYITVLKWLRNDNNKK